MSYQYNEQHAHRPCYTFNGRKYKQFLIFITSTSEESNLELPLVGFVLLDL